MNFFEKHSGRFSAYVSPELYPIEIAKRITERLGIDPDDVASRLESFFNQCDERLRVYKFDELPALANQLELDLRQVKVGRPDEGQQIATAELIFTRGRIALWTSEEIEAARLMAHPSAIVGFTWHSARTSSGEELSRTDVRQSMRAASYSDDAWRKYLDSLPKIQAPSLQG